MDFPERKKNNLNNSIEMLFYLSLDCENIALQYVEKIRVVKTEEWIAESRTIEPRINLGRTIEEILEKFHTIIISKIDSIQTIVQNQKIFPCDISIQVKNDLTFSATIPEPFFQSIYKYVQQHLQERKINYGEFYSIPPTLKL
ncbi:MAG: hypothetical protein AABY22_19600 [Nanoarchaeota archaeon]